MNFVRKLSQHPVNLIRSRYIVHARRNASTSSTKDSEEVVLIDVEDEAEKAKREEEIELKRNKSRLYPDHYALYHGQNPYPEPVTEYHTSLRYKRRLFGKYGESSGVDPSVLWPTKDELADTKEYQALENPYTFPEMIERMKTKKAEDLKVKLNREAEILEKAAKIEQWKKEFHLKAQRKAEEVKLAKEKKDRIVEEIRRHFGFKIDPRDERFKEMMEKKEKEAKKLSKAEKQKAKDMKILAEAQVAAEKEKEQAAAAEDDDDDDEDKTKKS